MRLTRIALFSILLIILTFTLSYAVNTHGVRTQQGEMQSWFRDNLGAHIVDGCTPAVPASSLTIAAFSCRAYVEEGGQLAYVDQPAVSVTIANATPTWLGLRRDRRNCPAGWTCVIGTHYMYRQNTTRPAKVSGALVFAEVTVVGGVITAIEKAAEATGQPNSNVFNLAHELTSHDDIVGTLDTIKAQARDGDVIFLPCGDYRMLTGWTLDKSLILRGANPTCTTITMDAAAGAANQWTLTDSNIIIEGIHFVGNGQGATSSEGNGIRDREEGDRHVIIRGNKFSNHAGNAISFEMVNSATRTFNIWIQNNFFSDGENINDFQFEVSLLGSYEGVWITDNHCIADAATPKAGCIGVGTRGGSTNLLTRDIIIRGNQVRGAYKRQCIITTEENDTGIVNSSSWLITENILTGCEMQGIKAKNGVRSIVTNNIIRDTNSIGEGSGISGDISANGCHQCVVANNMIIGGRDGILSTSVPNDPAEIEKGVVISGNAIANMSAGGIRLDSSPQGVSITGNSIYDCGTNGIIMNRNGPDSDYGGITIAGNTIEDCVNGIVTSNANIRIDDISIIGNIIRGSTANGITLTGIDRLDIKDNSILDTTLTGILIIDVTGVSVEGNTIDGVATGAQANAPITNAIFRHNTIRNATTPLNASNWTEFYGNEGFATENSGTATVLAGQAAVVVNHGLAITPALQDITLQLASSPSAVVAYWPSAINATNFTLNVSASPTENVDFSWQIRRYR